MQTVLILIAVSCCLLIGNSAAVDAVDLPLINAARSKDAIVNGYANPDSAPITIYDLSYPVRTALGSGISMDNDGNFAVLVSPELIEGHEIIAVDKEGRASQPVVVTAPDSDAGTAQ